jgi:predicted transcriptional regulator
MARAGPMTRKTKTVSFRASPVLQRRIEELAEARGMNRSKAIQAALVEATVPEEASAVPSEQELLHLLGEAARAGNVAAMKELRAYHREHERDETETPKKGSVEALDELASRRPRRTGA